MEKLLFPLPNKEIADHILNSFQNIGQKISPAQSVLLHIISTLTDTFI